MMISSISSAGSAYYYQKLDTSKLSNKTDANQDSNISKSEIEAISNYANKTTDDGIFSEIDTDEDGSVTQEEYDDFIKKLQENTDKMLTQIRETDSSKQSSEVSKLFSKIDSNQDNSANQGKPPSFSAKMQQDATNQVSGINSSGQTTSTSSDTDTSSKVFSEMDTNQDGTVSQEEMEAYFEKKNQEMEENIGQNTGFPHGKDATGQGSNTVSGVNGSSSGDSGTDSTFKAFPEMNANQDSSISQEETLGSNSGNNSKSYQYSHGVQEYLKSYNLMTPDLSQLMYKA
ncbi:Calcium-binding EF-hand-containing protein [Desulfofarcimen acetoxidans DSM 771]|uniref:Calcium-binding EF-hand-containing protein n=1 Tax=Desulfofarcimen acetoxidans (strain ATCC 49208 / DSM 771 / KCTC 5769 / VKM B-1644 / 5575) TaxID=485916 RepID=C8VYA5_DESAS|nr:EF-hand domain-containing protein [Desulfofarcimen acetoxidans]ACV62786.1 Calcium-binding EF-hand-containing protein [Desulfofarcimen acetoxidans DSM 771]